MQLFTNNATSKLVAGISNVSLSLQVSAGDGAKFPNPTGGDYFLATLSRVTSGIESNVEIVKVTARATDVFTIIRAQEGTSALVYLEDDFVQLRMTAATATDTEAHKGNTANPHAVTAAQVGAPSGSGTSTGTNTGDQTITLTGGVTGSGTGAFAATVVTNANLTGEVTSVGNATTVTNAAVIGKVLTGYVSGAGTVAATDTILQAINKLNGNVFAERTSTATLTNKTITSPVLTTPTLSTEAVAVTTNNLPALHPSLNLDFANGRTVDPRITFTRASTATRVNSKGLIETVASGVPRIDYDPVTLACKGLLIEEARTNLLTYSEQFDNAAWGKTRSSITANAATAPDGTTTADKLVEDTTASSTHVLNRASATTVSANTAHTKTIFAKAAGRTQFYYVLTNGAYTSSVKYLFDLAAVTVSGSPAVTGTASAYSASITPLGDGWFRCSVTCVVDAASTTINSNIELAASGSVIYTGDGTSGLYIWGAQLEAGFATSYIPTTSAQVTRAADVATMTGTNFSSWYRQDEGSFVCDWAQSLTTSTADTFGLFRVSGTSGAPPIISSRIGYAGFRRIRSYAQDTGAFFEYVSEGNAETSNSGKFSLTYAATNDFATSSSGATVVTDTAGSISDFSCNTLQLGLATSQLNGHIARLAYYPKRLTNVELQALSA